MTRGLLAALLLGAAATGADAAQVFWASEPVRPGDVVLVYGGDLGRVREVGVWRLADGEPASPPGSAAPSPGRPLRVPALQPDEGSLKFVLPAALAPGVFEIDVDGARRLLGRPRVDWIQPVRLLPGLDVNQAAPGTVIQVIGRNFPPEGGPADQARVVLRATQGGLVPLRVDHHDRYALRAALPADLAAGSYEVWVHNGYGGPTAWGGGAALTVRPPEAWPTRVLNVRDLGARGDNVTDDSEAFRRALEATERNGGGVIHWPPGTYRLHGVFRLPPRVVLRGAGKDATWLKWPQSAPRSEADVEPAALRGAGGYALESLSLMVRNARTVLRDASFDTADAPSPASQPSESGPAGARPSGPAPGPTRDVFLRDVRIHYLPYAGRPSDTPQKDPQWALGRWGITNGTRSGLTLAVAGVRNIEISGSEFVGVQRLNDLDNARLVGNVFENPMGVSWTDIGGQHLVVERNRFDGASSWRAGRLPLRHVYASRNSGRNLGRGEREVLTFDVNHAPGRFGPEPWLGAVTAASGRTLQLERPPRDPGAYRGHEALVVSGRGAGQYREIADAGPAGLSVTRDWDVVPDASSTVLVHRLMGHCVMHRNVAEDTSVLFQVWGALYDCIFDGNTVTRSQGMWGLAGWFLQWIDNVLDGAVTFQAGIGPRGATPEGTAEYGFIGFTIGGRTALLKPPFEFVRGAVIRGNQLRHGHRVLVMWGYGGERRRAGFQSARDVVVDRNRIENSAVGIELDANVAGAVVANNSWTQVERPLRLLAPEQVLVLEAPRTLSQAPGGGP